MFFFSDFLYKSICCGYSFELHRQADAFQMGSHNICLCQEVDKKYTGCILETTELLDCALIGVCVVRIWWLPLHQQGDHILLSAGFHSTASRVADCRSRGRKHEVVLSFQEYHQSVKQFGSRSGLMFCRA